MLFTNPLFVSGSLSNSSLHIFLVSENLTQHIVFCSSLGVVGSEGTGPVCIFNRLLSLLHLYYWPVLLSFVSVGWNQLLSLVCLMGLADLSLELLSSCFWGVHVWVYCFDRSFLLLLDVVLNLLFSLIVVK